MGCEVYPGDQVGIVQTLSLASEYHGAACDLIARCRRGQPASRAPARLCAIHAVELFLNAFLLSAGVRPGTIRGLQHNLAARGDLAVSAGLRLRTRTHAHLQMQSETREYLVTRYDPTLSATLTPDNRMMATLAEISVKVRKAVEAQAPLRHKAVIAVEI